MTDDKDRTVAESEETETTDEAETEESATKADEEEDEVAGHVSAADVWAPSPNSWRRRR